MEETRTPPLPLPPQKNPRAPKQRPTDRHMLMNSQYCSEDHTSRDQDIIETVEYRDKTKTGCCISKKKNPKTKKQPREKWPVYFLLAAKTILAVLFLNGTMKPNLLFHFFKMMESHLLNWIVLTSHDKCHFTKICILPFSLRLSLLYSDPHFKHALITALSAN